MRPSLGPAGEAVQHAASQHREGVRPEALYADLATLVRQGQRIVVVHGGSDETNRLSEQLGHPPRFVTSPSGYTSRYTDRETLEIVVREP